jgi:hypothetical protein
MVSSKIAKMCEKVVAQATELDKLTDGGHAGTVYALMLRMKLANSTVELVYEDLVDRLMCK